MPAQCCTREGKGARERREEGGTERPATHLWWWTGLLRSRRIGHTSDTVPLPLSLRTQHHNVRPGQLARTKVRASIAARAKLEPAPVDKDREGQGDLPRGSGSALITSTTLQKQHPPAVSPAVHRPQHRAACRAQAAATSTGRR